MKKMRMMVLALAASVTLVGAGYAAWGTKITYNNSVKTAEWNVVVENDVADSLKTIDSVQNFEANYTVTGTTSEELTEKYGTFETVNNNDLSGADKVNSNFVYSIKPTITQSIENDDTVNFKFFNMHPGTSVETVFEIRNLGSIPAKIADVKVSLTDKNGNAVEAGSQLDELVKAMVITGSFYDHDGSSTSTKIGDLGNGVKFWELEGKLKQILVAHVLNEKHDINVLDSEEVEVAGNGLTFAIPANALKGADGTNLARLQQLNVKVEFDFVQYNQNVADIQ